MNCRTRSRAKRANVAHTKTEYDQTLFAVLSLCFTNARLKQDTELNSLARLACSSKQLRALVQQYVQRNIGCMLSVVAGQAHNAQKVAQEHRYKGPTQSVKEKEFASNLAQAKWLCRMSGAKSLTQQIRELLRVRRVPKEVTEMVLSSGVQLTTAHLVEAAMARVEGLDTWVLEPYCRELPQVVCAVFEGSVDTFKNLLPSLGSPNGPHLVDLLHLAINYSRCSAPAEALLQHLTVQSTILAQKRQQLQQQEGNPGQWQRCIATRHKTQRDQQQQALRQEIIQLEQLVQDSEAQLNSPRLLEQLLATAVARKHHKVVTALCQLPAAQQLSGNAVLQLLHRCIVHKVPCKVVLEQLLALAEGIGASTACAVAKAAGDTSQLLHLQQQQDPGPAVPAVRGSAADSPVQAVAATATGGPHSNLLQPQPLLAGVTEVTQLLVVAVQRGNVDAVRLLARKPAGQSVDAETAAQLAQDAVELRNDDLLIALTAIPAVEQLPAAVIEQLLSVAVMQGAGSVQLVRTLCSLQLAAAIPATAMACLLHAAVQQCSRSLVEQLASSPALQSITSDTALQLLEAAIAGLPATESALLALCDLTPAGNVPAAALEQLIRHVLRHPYCTSGVVSCLCQLAPAQLMPPSALEEILRDTLNTNQTGMLHILCALPGAQQMSGSALYGLLRTVLWLSRPIAHSLVAQLLASLMPSAQQLTVHQVHDLLQDVIQSGISGGSFITWSVLKTLAALPAAEDVRPEQAAALIRASLHLLRARDALNMLLCELLPARAMSAASIASLVRDAILLDCSAVTGHKLDAAIELLLLPGALDIDTSSIASLLLLLFEQARCNTLASDADELMQSLVCLPRARHITPAQFEDLVRSLFMLHGRHDSACVMAASWLPMVLTLPAAKQISHVAVESLIRTALQRPWALRHLLTALNAGDVLDAAAVERLLTHVISPSVSVSCGLQGLSRASYAGSQLIMSWPSHCIPHLVKLPAFNSMPVAAITNILHCAIQHNRADALKSLCQPDGPAGNICKAALLRLLRTAVMRMTGKGVTYVCRLLVPHGLTRAEIDALVTLNEEMGHAFDRSLAALLQGLLR